MKFIFSQFPQLVKVSRKVWPDVIAQATPEQMSILKQHGFNPNHLPKHSYICQEDGVILALSRGKEGGRLGTGSQAIQVKFAINEQSALYGCKIMSGAQKDELECQIAQKLGYMKHKVLDAKGPERNISSKDGKLAFSKITSYQAFTYLGKSLDRVDLSVTQKKQVARKLFWQLYQLHTAGYIHHDIKPDNILIDDFFQPWIIDFGLSEKIIKQEGHDFKFVLAPEEYQREEERQYDWFYLSEKNGKIVFSLRMVESEGWMLPRLTDIDAPSPFTLEELNRLPDLKAKIIQFALHHITTYNKHRGNPMACPGELIEGYSTVYSKSENMWIKAAIPLTIEGKDLFALKKTLSYFPGFSHFFTEKEYASLSQELQAALDTANADKAIARQDTTLSMTIRFIAEELDQDSNQLLAWPEEKQKYLCEIIDVLDFFEVHCKSVPWFKRKPIMNLIRNDRATLLSDSTIVLKNKAERLKACFDFITEKTLVPPMVDQIWLNISNQLKQASIKPQLNEFFLYKLARGFLPGRQHKHSETHKLLDEESALATVLLQNPHNRVNDQKNNDLSENKDYSISLK
ncbi:hypothetical protein EP47_12405 [Legionella norrlandica]|uniref:Protein kinase domain-containing protein n=2 Tax=Legionella norrlandica TaxID=1498499 RepID=A0A0A2SVT0_9GAMM|nr:hypothetical protein EP47_12405 [Legionella norrlandica]